MNITINPIHSTLGVETLQYEYLAAYRKNKKEIRLLTKNINTGKKILFIYRPTILKKFIIDHVEEDDLKFLDENIIKNRMYRYTLIDSDPKWVHQFFEAWIKVDPMVPIRKNATDSGPAPYQMISKINNYTFSFEFEGRQY